MFNVFNLRLSTFDFNVNVSLALLTRLILFIVYIFIAIDNISPNTKVKMELVVRGVYPVCVAQHCARRSKNCPHKSERNERENHSTQIIQKQLHSVDRIQSTQRRCQASLYSCCWLLPFLFPSFMPIIAITVTDVDATTIAAHANVHAQKRSHAKLHQKFQKPVHRLRLPPQQQQQPPVQQPHLQPHSPLQLWIMANHSTYATHIFRYRSATKECVPKRTSVSTAAAMKRATSQSH